LLIAINIKNEYYLLQEKLTKFIVLLAMDEIKDIFFTRSFVLDISGPLNSSGDCQVR
jgi:hypothetical protein